MFFSKSVSRTFFFLSFLLSAFVSVQAEEFEFRTWTSKDGKFTIEAKYLKGNREMIELERKDGKTGKVELSGLSEADVKYVRSLEAKPTVKNVKPFVDASKPLTSEDILAVSEELKIPRNTYGYSTNSHQGGGEIEKAFDGDPDTIWHSAWGSPNDYPFHIDVQFKKEEWIERIDYLPRKSGGNGRFLEYGVYVRKNGNWKKVHAGTMADNSEKKTVRFEPVRCKLIRIEVTKGVGGFASAAEIDFHRPDKETNTIASWFTDLSYSEFRKDEKGKIPNAQLKEEIEKLKYSTKRRDLWDDILLAEKLLKNPREFEGNVVTVIQKPSASKELSWRRGGFPWSYFQPTGHAVEKGDVFTVYLEADSGSPVPGLIITDLRTYDWNAQSRISLVPGKNIITAERSGILYIDNPHEPENQKTVPVMHFLGTTKYPFYQHGKTTAKQWSGMMNAPNPVGMVEIYSPHVLITVHDESARKHLDSPVELCKAYEYLMDRYAKLMGFSETDPPPHTRPKNLIHLIEVDKSFMYATNHRTAYVTGSLGSVINSRGVLKDGWGPWHEIGHMHQVQQYKFRGLGEVTVNIYSLEMQTSLGSKARIDEEGMHDKIRAFIESPDRNYHANDDVFMKLAMFWQLRMAFGDEFYPRLHRYYRENDLPIENDDDRVQYFMRISSMVAGYNLKPFFDAWGLHADEETKLEIEEYRELKTRIWKNLNFSSVPPKGTVGIYAPKK